MLEDTLDKEYMDYILSGIGEGFRISHGRYGNSNELSSARRNMQAAEENAQWVSDRFGMIPKSDKPGKWWHTVDQKKGV